MNSSNKWFVKRAGKVQGPFTHQVLLKLAKLGRLKPTDQLSHDQEHWQKASSFSKLFPLDESQLLLKDDERSGLDRRDEEEQTDTQLNDMTERQIVDRRSQEPIADIDRRKGRTRLLQAIKKSHAEDRFPLKTILISIISIVSLAIIFTPTKNEVEADCNAAAKAEVVWDNCQLSNSKLINKDLSGASIKNAVLSGSNFNQTRLVSANLSFTDLNKASFENANLNNAILIGVDLQSANLVSASLRETDLSYADLRGAKLKNADLTNTVFDKTIWIDGKICAVGSVGRCLKD